MKNKELKMKDWFQIKLKYFISIQKGKNPVGFSNDIVSLPYLSMEFLRGKTKSPTYVLPQENLVEVNENDSLILWDGANAGEVMKSKEGYLSSTMAVIKFKKELFLSSFLFYFLKSNEPTFKKDANGTTIPHFDPTHLLHSSFLIPSLTTQTAIANFLDYKTAKIDRFIRKKKQLIKLLNEQKAGIINNAVTKGITRKDLACKVSTKPSGVEWLGDIPEHWEVVKLTGLCDFVRGNSTFKKDELLSNGTYVALQYGKTYKVNEVNEKYEFYVNDEFYKDSQIVNFGDVIFISTSETIEDLGHSVFYNRCDLGLLGGEQILLKPNISLVQEKYLYYSSKVFAKDLKKFATGVKVYRFKVHDLKTIYTSVPPLSEQQQIVSYIETETTKLNKAMATIEKEITLVQEYRTALIAEAVTGKIDVRDYEIPIMEQTENDEELEEEMSIAAEDGEEYETIEE